MIKIEKWVEEKQREKGFNLAKSCLYLLSLFFRSGIALRHSFYRLNLFSKIEADLPVISVGNVVCGGTGKTEFVAKLIADLKRDDLAVLSRGYRSKREGGPSVVKDIDDGDEPFMLASRLKNTFVIRGKRREKSAELAKSLGAKGCILDDGMQYLRLKKDLQIAMISAKDPFGRGFVPYGMRREQLKKLRDMDYIIIHGAVSEKIYELVKSDVLCYSNAKCFGSTYCLKKNTALTDKKVGVFCGVGNPQLFMRGLEDLKLKIVKKRVLADHQKFENVSRFVKECKAAGAETVVCTTKDYVKLNRDEQTLVTPIQISMEIPHDAETYHTLIEEVNNIIDLKNSKRRIEL